MTIIFDLDCLAEDSHRRHFIENPYSCFGESPGCNCSDPQREFSCPFDDYNSWKPDYKAYNEACGGDKPIESCADIIRQLSLRFPEDRKPIHVWSNTPELYKEKIQDWMWYNIGSFKYELKMRPNDND